MGNKIIFHEIISEKPQKLVNEFYAKLFDWDILEDPEIPFWYISTDAGENIQAGIGKIKPEDPAYHKMVSFYVQVDSVDDSLMAAEKLGGKIIMKKASFPFKNFQFTVGMFSDPQGNIIGVMEPIKKA
jgi:predicted enzyme related to lactoylglutathione lyase